MDNSMLFEICLESEISWNNIMEDYVKESYKGILKEESNSEQKESIIQKIKRWIVERIKAIKEFFKKVGKMIKEFFQKALNLVKGKGFKLNDAKDVVKKEKIKVAVKTDLKEVPKAINDIDKINNKVVNMKGEEITNEIVEEISQGIDGILKNVIKDSVQEKQLTPEDVSNAEKIINSENQMEKVINVNEKNSKRVMDEMNREVNNSSKTNEEKIANSNKLKKKDMLLNKGTAAQNQIIASAVKDSVKITNAVTSSTKSKNEDKDKEFNTVHETVIDLVEKRDIKSLSFIFADALDVDPTFKKYRADYEYCKSKGMLVSHKELTPFINDKFKWDNEYWKRLKMDLVKNFSQRRMDHMIEVAKVFLKEKYIRIEREREERKNMGR